MRLYCISRWDCQADETVQADETAQADETVQADESVQADVHSVQAAKTVLAL